MSDSVVSAGAADAGVMAEAVRLEPAAREHLLRRVAKAVLHTNRAAGRGDREAVAWHRGYRKGVYDALEELGYGADVEWMKPRAFRWGRRSARGHSSPLDHDPADDDLPAHNAEVEYRASIKERT